ncbi:MAG: hypothetical protein JO270_26180 [Acidobacteriaceae bacterium]|nr:hypothetical protein [Acidobacteriaceae bacterium]MBV8570087.1 hypothetical protein [Acidobacteriaceae bacterium]
MTELRQLAEKNPEFAILLGSDYVIAPDVLAVWTPEPARQTK